MKAFFRGLWITFCAIFCAVGGAYFGWQYNLAGALILGALGLAFGAELAFAGPRTVLRSIVEFVGN
jgi:hypothetical protein